MRGNQNPSILDGIVKQENEFNTHDQVLILEASDGKRTIGQHPACYERVSGKFKDPLVNQPGKATPKLGVLVNDGRGNFFRHKNRDLLGSCLTQDNINHICEIYPDKLVSSARRNIFLFEEGGKFHFAIVCILDGKLLIEYADYEKGVLMLLGKKHRSFVKVDIVTK